MKSTFYSRQQVCISCFVSILVLIPVLAIPQSNVSVVISAIVDNTRISRDRNLEFAVTLTWNKALHDISIESTDTPICENLVITGNFFSSDAKTSDTGQIVSSHYGFILKPQKVGTAKIGSVTITYTDNETGEEKSLTSSSIEVFVTKPLSDRLYVLKIVTKYLLIALIIAFIAIFIFKFFKKRKIEKERLKVIASIPTIEERYIDEMKSIYSKLQTIGRKDYSSMIARLLKKYIEEKFEIDLKGATTDRILTSLNSIDLLKQDSVDLLISIFDFCDSVKFAGSEPAREDIDNLQLKAESFISSMKEAICSNGRGNKDE